MLCQILISSVPAVFKTYKSYQCVAVFSCLNAPQTADIERIDSTFTEPCIES